jgi:biopolymer transport protein ExbB
MTNLIFLFQDTISGATQEAAAAVAPVTPKEETFLEVLMKGGVMVIPIMVLLFFTLYVIIERAMYYSKVTKTSDGLMNELRFQLSSGKVETAQITASKAGTAEGNILESGISHIGRPLSEIEGMMEKTTNVEIGLMEKKLGWLGLVAGTAPILGFIGTIVGVITIFKDIAIKNEITINVISEGLYQKMISSGLGLVVGVIAYAAYHYFNMTIDSFSLRVQRQVIQFVNLITTGK